MNLALREAFEAELAAGHSALEQHALDEAFDRFERAHILGQHRTWAHVRAHVGMLQVGFRRRDIREVVGQVTRILAASLFSRIWVPVGNTGGANVSAVRPMRIPEDLQRYFS